jgi:hypothetical protein
MAFELQISYSYKIEQWGFIHWLRDWSALLFGFWVYSFPVIDYQLVRNRKISFNCLNPTQR